MLAIVKQLKKLAAIRSRVDKYKQAFEDNLLQGYAVLKKHKDFNKTTAEVIAVDSAEKYKIKKLPSHTYIIFSNVIEDINEVGPGAWRV